MLGGRDAMRGDGDSSAREDLKEAAYESKTGASKAKRRGRTEEGEEEDDPS